MLKKTFLFSLLFFSFELFGQNNKTLLEIGKIPDPYGGVEDMEAAAHLYDLSKNKNNNDK